MNCSLQEGQSSNPFGKQETDSDNEDGRALVKQPAKKTRCVTSDIATCNARQCCGLCNQATPEDGRVAQGTGTAARSDLTDIALVMCRKGRRAGRR